MTMTVLMIWGPLLLLLGSVSGFLAGLLGVGGGIVLVPGLYYMLSALGFPPDPLMHVAVGTSLAVIVPTGLSSASAHHRRGAVRFDLVRTIGAGAIAGAVAGFFVASSIDGAALQIIFACAMGAVAVMMAADARYLSVWSDVPAQPWRGIAGGGIGFLSTLMGIGGATLSVPFMTMGRVDIKHAVGTASALGLLISVPASLGFVVMGWSVPGLPPFQIGYVNYVALALIAPMAVLVAPLGARVAHAVDAPRLRRAFALFLLIVAVRMLCDVIFDS